MLHRKNIFIFSLQIFFQEYIVVMLQCNKTILKEIEMEKAFEQGAVQARDVLDAFVGIGNMAFGAVERFAALNLNAAKTMLDDGAKFVKEASEKRDFQELATLQQSFVQPQIAQGISYMRSVFEIAAQSRDDFEKVIDSRRELVSKQADAVFANVVKHAPAGSDVVVSGMKSVVAAAASMSENVSRTTRQMVEIGDANVSAALSAAASATKSSQKKKS